MFMISIEEEIITMADLYAADRMLQWNEETKQMITTFACHVLQQKLQQCSVSGSLPLSCVDGFTDDKFCDKAGQCAWCLDKRQ